jgi:hypothetical protein
MLERRMLCCFAFGAAAFAQPPPVADEQSAVLAQIREAAQAYVRNLPDFICMQSTRREIELVTADAPLGVKESSQGRGNVAHVGGGRPRSSDTFEEQLTYFDHQENYQLIKVNGKRQKPGQPRPPGMTSTGEFGTTLSAIVDPETGTAFEWRRWDTLRGQPVYVFAFRVEQSRSNAELRIPSESVVVGYHGLIYADRERKTVMRVTTEAEAPKDFPMQEVRHLLDFGWVTISGRQFVLPLRAEMESRMTEDFIKYGRIGGHSREVELRNYADFREYRKYAADSELKPEAEKPQ